VPRAAWIALSYSQIFLISAAVKFLEIPVDERHMDTAYGLIGATALIYVGIAVSTILESHK
jgi:ATP-binding cassette, subfamily C (CFTR/MRP), member 1